MAICTQGSKLDQHAREGTILDLHGEPYKAPKSCCDSHRHHLLPRQGSPITPDGTVAGLQSDHGVRFRRGLRSAHVYVETKRSSPSNTEKLHILVVFIAQSSILGFESSLPKIKEKRRLVRAFTLSTGHITLGKQTGLSRPNDAALCEAAMLAQAHLRTPMTNVAVKR